ncbi:uncharacterized protein AMSG_01013 [Thecamonas trahens ATCC 50062]|uniref:Uncharacterized protein n=1 Tax=Thecamonas trahens ATCC 50062 TaxID=461836 RepID=A0A0L0DIQ9_THETB|nr:hypothetical protein AMSG_01013 [Thecamonas trahens ATCC 50062]KNC52187.1 hypothetical protein AMSG_01013 [Thecamonas trahens ATCC 50062]|eukprot:XP_013762190.1 hypothetical protein AMSG_01013 [Thecamonas trahens ATCC 50062]
MKSAAAAAAADVGRRDVLDALKVWLLNPTAGGADDPVCAAMYGWVQTVARASDAAPRKASPSRKSGGGGGGGGSSSSSRTSAREAAAAAALDAAVVVPLVPVFVARYLHGWATGAALPGLEALLLMIHNKEAALRASEPQRMTLPVLSRPSVFHDPAVMTGVAAGDDVDASDAAPFPVAVDLPLRTTAETTWTSMSMVLATALGLVRDALIAGSLSGSAVEIFCEMTAAAAAGSAAAAFAALPSLPPSPQASAAAADHAMSQRVMSSVLDSDSAWSESDSDSFFDAEDELPSQATGLTLAPVSSRPSCGFKVSRQMHDAMVACLHHVLASDIRSAPSLLAPAAAAVDALYHRATLAMDSHKLVACLALKKLRDP